MSCEAERADFTRENDLNKLANILECEIERQFRDVPHWTELAAAIEKARAASDVRLDRLWKNVTHPELRDATWRENNLQINIQKD